MHINPARPSWRLAVRFVDPPPWPRFFALERLLAQWLNRPIDLIPADQLDQYLTAAEIERLHWSVL